MRDIGKPKEYEIKTGCDRGLCHQAIGRQDRQLNTYDWLADVPGNTDDTDLVEVQFKHTRKGYYHNLNKLDLKKGDIVAVEANPGHDIGVVTLTGRLVNLQIKKANLKSSEEIRRVYRIARPVDMEKFREAKSREHATMIESRQIAKNLGLKMKIGDVEYQGDCNKAIFYYIADERVDFRQLIKDFAAEFNIRIEMKQIGARQEAGLIGGLGVCGRPLCCSGHMSDFQSITTQAARCQDLSLNPQKLAGQCSKLKCCINYEASVYIDAQKGMPQLREPLEFKDGKAYLVKTDILRGLMYFSYDKDSLAKIWPLSFEEAAEIAALNRKGIQPDSLQDQDEGSKETDFVSAIGDDSITRFDERRKKRRNNRNRQNRRQKDRGADKGQEKNEN